jgi:oligopeptide transport system ATP-binding protein
MLLEVKNLKKYFPVGRKQMLRAVDDVSFFVMQGETVGLVGESGCGKTTLGRTIIGLHKPTGGQVIFDGKDITKLSRKEAFKQTKNMQMIFQDPYASLNPRMTVADIIAEGLDLHKMYRGIERQKRINDLLNLVGMLPEQANRFPHEFSGGQRQRVGIARALAVEPKLIICDEPISALDVSIQAQVINLLHDLQRELGLTYLFIAHDLAMVEHISNRVGVMYLGSIMEFAPSHELMMHPLHPYTIALLSAVPFADPDASRARNRVKMQGDIPSPITIVQGCKFQTRCPHCMDKCREAAPPMREIRAGHFVACYKEEILKSNV